MSKNIIFMGSPDFAIPALQQLADKFTVRAVVTQPDRRAGRGRSLSPPPVKETALALGLEVFQPPSLRTPEAFEQLKSYQPDLIVVAAFGQILKPNVLNLPPLGCINVHASLLPRWRGASPINAAILHGDDASGVTIMKMDAGLDTGPILSARAVPITPTTTAGELSDTLAQLG
ncbi:MAG TPA: methionyl-tRNA formyltransferase, partial [Anaerolineales bacterium]|nr:methionyl-tRNA formyltransferase [Anaerolineales bacterium]